MNIFRRRLQLAALAAGLAGLAGGEQLLAPTENIRADFRNEVHPYATTPTDKFGVALGPGAGHAIITGAVATNMITFQSAIGVGVTVQPANIMLGEVVEPPEDWDGTRPTIEADTGGKLVWLDYAKTVIAIESGPVDITWRRKNGSVERTTGTVSASPAKRPVRLYWTHQRPKTIDPEESYRSLQNAGPTVSFGSNYRVTLHETAGIKVWNEDPKKGDVHTGCEADVRLVDNTLQAFEGATGTFLITYSRLDEASGKEVLLAYELVTVLEPMQTQIDVKLGQQLRPISRSFETAELYPTVTRGLTDETDQDEVYVYQHNAGAQKNYLWAIRDSSQEPWKIEVFWRAKEELDVIWPFEVDIYAAGWDEENAQVYIRDCETDAGGTAPAEPIVFLPTAVKATVMDYQVPKKHFNVSDKGFYSDYADDRTFALLKYTSGETVWFQTVRSVPAKNTTLLKNLGYDLEGILSNRRWWTGDADEALPDAADVTNAVLAAEIRAPFAGAEGFFYPGWIKKQEKAPAGYPILNPYNAGLYTYPTEYTLTNSVYAPIFPVNLGQIEVWWQLPSVLTEEQPVETGHTGPMTSPIFFPAFSCTYTVRAPEETYFWDNGVPQIVIASGKGSRGYALSDYDPYVASPSIYFAENWGDPLEDGVVVASLDETTIRSGVTTNFTVEARFALDAWDYNDLKTCIPWASFKLTNEEAPYLEIGFDACANLYIGGVRKTDFDAVPDPVYANIDEDCPKIQFHLAVSHGDDGKWRYYVNGMRQAEFDDDATTVLTFNRSNVHLFCPNMDKALENGNPASFVGHMVNFRVWSAERTWESIHDGRYEANTNGLAALVVQFADQPPRPGFEDDYQWDVTTSLQDTSPYGNIGRLQFDPSVDGGLVQAGLFSGAPIKPRLGVILDQDAEIYRQCDRTLPGFNPNEEHALMVNGVVHALRCDLNVTSVAAEGNPYEFTSLPYVLVQYADPYVLGHYAMQAIRVVPENDMYRFRKFHVAGNMIQAPDPLAQLQPANLMEFMSGPVMDGQAPVDGKSTCFRDRKGWYWAHQAGDDGGVTNYVFEFSYPSQPTFDYPEGRSAPAVGEASSGCRTTSSATTAILAHRAAIPCGTRAIRAASTTRSSRAGQTSPRSST